MRREKSKLVRALGMFINPLGEIRLPTHSREIRQRTELKYYNPKNSYQGQAQTKGKIYSTKRKDTTRR